MRSQDQGWVFLKSGFIIGQVDSVGGSHFQQTRSRLFHYIGNTEAATNLYELGTGNYHCPSAPQ